MWQTYYSVLYYISSDYKFHNKFAMFSFNETLVKNIKLAGVKYDFVIYKLKELIANNINIIIYENIDASNKYNYMKAIEKFINKCMMPNNILVFLASARDKYTKPLTGILYLINTLAETQKIKIEMLVGTTKEIFLRLLKIL